MPQRWQSLRNLEKVICGPNLDSRAGLEHSVILAFLGNRARVSRAARSFAKLPKGNEWNPSDPWPISANSYPLKRKKVKSAASQCQEGSIRTNRYQRTTTTGGLHCSRWTLFCASDRFFFSLRHSSRMQTMCWSGGLKSSATCVNDGRLTAISKSCIETSVW